MNRPNLVRLLATGVAVVAAAITLQGRQQAVAGTGLLAGRVVDAVSGSGVGAAVVALSIAPAAAPAGAAPAPAAQTRRAVAVANDDGRFVFRDLPAGSYTISSTFEGFAPGASGRRRPAGPSRPIVLAEGARQNDLVISMWRLSSISGVVRDDRGEPMVGVAVSVMRRVSDGGRNQLTYGNGAITDDRGHYRAFGLLPGAYVVTIGTATHTAAVSTVDAYHAAVTAGTTAAMRQIFSETWALDISRAGLVVNDWQLRVSSAQAQPLMRPDGGVLIQPRVLYPNTTNVSDAEVLTIGSGMDRTGVDLTVPLIQGMRVSGVLNTSTGPAANHGIRLVPAVRGDSDLALETPVAYCTTDATGRFAFLGVTPGAYVILAHRVPRTGPMPPAPPAAGAAPVYTEAPPPAAVESHFAEVPVTVAGSHIDGLSVTLRPGARLSGRIAFEGTTAPPPAARIQQASFSLRLLGGREAAPPAPVRPNAEGRFATNGYAPGRYLVAAVTPPAPEWTLASIRIGGVEAAGQAFTIGDRDVDDVVITFTDKVINLSGDVRAADANGSPEATVVLFPANFQAWLASGMSPRRLMTAVTSAGGSYQIRVPLPGDYLLVALGPEVVPDVDADFVKRFSGAAVRVTLASGDTKTQPLTIARVR